MEIHNSNKADCVMVINCGSSSLKFALFAVCGEAVILKGLAERLGSSQATLTVERNGDTTVTPIPSASHRIALREAINWMDGLNPVGIGHRVVHGGEEFTSPVVIDQTVMDAIESCSNLAPLHNPANLSGVRTAREIFTSRPHVAVFDTAFHQSLPSRAFLYAIPGEYYETLKVRRYGFHGTSHQFVFLEGAKILGTRWQDTHMISIHLGNGCSACAIKSGRSVDTTMGLTPGEGLVMGTRSGDVDPGLHQFLQDQTGMSLGEITTLLNSQSGLLGLSGLSNDMRTLSEAARDGHPKAKLAIEVFCYRLAKSICGLLAALDTVDAIVFTGGIGENSPEVRAITASYLKIPGIILDAERNAEHGRANQGRISSSDSAIPCLVIPTNEELMIARETLRLISPPSTTP